MLQPDYTTRIRPNMDVFDLDGDKVGTVGKVHVPAGVTGAMGAPGAAPTEPSGVIHVDTGFLGLGKDLYIPFSAIREVRDDGVHLNVDKDDLDRMAWDRRPDWLGTESY